MWKSPSWFLGTPLDGELNHFLKLSKAYVGIFAEEHLTQIRSLLTPFLFHFFSYLAEAPVGSAP